MSIPTEYYCSRLVVVRLLYKVAVFLSLLIRWLLLPCRWAAASHNNGAAEARLSVVSAHAVKKSLHVATYGEIMISMAAAGEETMCAVCLSEVGSRDRVWELRNCSHVFHKGCLDRWMDHDEHMTCPLCRAPLMTQANASTLSSEPSWAVERLLYLFGDDLLLTN